jgi:hypothetical protein
MKKTAIILFIAFSFSNFSNAQTVQKNEETNQYTIPLSDFPKFVNTGNIELDEFNYAIAKENWIALNPRAYDAVINASSVDLLPGFPVKEKTGNSEMDNINYKLAKDEWYTKYPELLNFYYSNNSKKYPSKSEKN